MSKVEKFWENATADDVARVMAGETVEARFRDFEKDEWKIAVLSGWSKFNERDRLPWATRGGLCYMYCQVYREPSWYANKPDPGPGYRLLGKLPDEPKKEGDDWFYAAENRWISVWNGSDEPQSNETWYRRRIEAEPEPKHYVLRAGDTVETPTGRKIKVISRTETQEVYALMPGNRVTLPNGQTITITEKGYEVTQ
jgi:hypothetical protein